MILALTAVTVEYGRRRTRARALHGIDLVLETGELVLVDGPPAAGKTSLLRVLAGTVRPSRGRRRVRGRRRRPRLALLEADSELPRVGSLARLLRYSAFLAGLRGQAAEAGMRAIAREWELQDHLQRPLGSLEPARARRTLIAATLLQGPAALLLDAGPGTIGAGEPVVDTLLRREASRGRLVVRVRRHEPAAVREGDRLIRLERGRLVLDRRGLRRAS